MIKYQENTKQFWTEIPNTNLALPFFGIPKYWLLIDIPSTGATNYIGNAIASSSFESHSLF